MKYVEKKQPDSKTFAVFASDREDFDTYGTDCRIVLGIYEAESAEAMAESFHELFGEEECPYLAVVPAAEVRWFIPADASERKDSR